ncbi:MAG: non-canonical purine NTP pyrophosphatase [Dehalococcoidia bacterium]
MSCCCARWRCRRPDGALDSEPSGRRRARRRRVHAREGRLRVESPSRAEVKTASGYDPVFELPDGRTVAELGNEKQAISHRARAMRAMMEVLANRAGPEPA